MQPRSTPITIIFKAAALSCSTLFPPASLFPSFSVSFLFSFFSVLFLLHFEEEKAKSESVYRVSLDPVQNLCLLDENPAVSQKERGIRNWTIVLQFSQFQSLSLSASLCAVPHPPPPSRLPLLSPIFPAGREGVCIQAIYWHKIGCVGGLGAWQGVL